MRNGQFLAGTHYRSSGACDYGISSACDGAYSDLAEHHDNLESLAYAFSDWNSCAVSRFFNDNAAADDWRDNTEIAASVRIGRIIL